MMFLGNSLQPSSDGAEFYRGGAVRGHEVLPVTVVDDQSPKVKTPDEYLVATLAA
ncbi:MAG: hypothetical protein HY080_12625 [Gammaproteobacteria bacterium]|nr:hypothetical protein [Gammaproteobacteria bacterium]